MTQLTEEMYAIFDRDEFSFKKLKSQYSEDELAQIKTDLLKVGPMVGTYAIITGQLIV